MKREYYTPEGRHPEDAIYDTKRYINRLQGHVDSCFDLLAYDLGLNDRGKDWLFDYVYNEDHKLTFEEYLDKYDVRYDDCVERIASWRRRK